MIGNLGYSLGELRAINQDIQKSAFADRTWKNLSSICKVYSQFCQLYSIRAFPVSGDDLCLFATWLFVSNRAHSAQTVRNYLSAVRTWHRNNGFECPTPTTHSPLNLTIRGLERKFSTPVRRMSPITPNILLKLVQFPANIFGNDLIIFTVIRSLYIHLFLSMLRLDSMVPQTAGCFDPIVQLVWGRVGKLDQGVVIKAIHTKQIQDRKRELEIPLIEKPGSELCPVSAFHRLLEIPGYPTGQTDPVYSIPAKDGGWVPLSRYQVVTVLDAQIAKMGLDPSLYRPHAFRRGGIQLAVKLVPNFELVRVHSDHASEAIEVYTNLPAEERFAVTQAMLAAL